MYVSNLEVKNTTDLRDADGEVTDEEPIIANDTPSAALRGSNERHTRIITVPEHVWLSLMTSVKDLSEMLTKQTGT